MTRQYALHQYDNLHRQQPFFGKGLEESLEDIPPGDFKRAVGHRTVAQLCMHMLAWRYDVIKRLTDAPRDKIELNSPQDWPATDGFDKAYFLSEFARTKTELQAALKGFDYGKTGEQLHQDYDYTWVDVLEGGAQHDIYHLGQINLIAAILKADQ